MPAAVRSQLALPGASAKVRVQRLARRCPLEPYELKIAEICERWQKISKAFERMGGPPSPSQQLSKLIEEGARSRRGAPCTADAGACNKDPPRQAADPRLAAHRTARRRVPPDLLRRDQATAELERAPRRTDKETWHGHPAPQNFAAALA